MSESRNDEDETHCTPPEICDQAEIATLDLLPTKSRALYETCYKSFTEWKRMSKTTSSSERVLMAYFNKLCKQYKPSTLWAHYSMLKTTLKINEKVDIKEYHTLSAFMKKQSQGYMSKKSKVFSTDEVQKFITQAPDEKYLLTKVVLIFGISGACRKDELTRIAMENIEVHGKLILVRIPDTETGRARSFTISKEFHTIVNKYQALRPIKTTTNRFFLNYVNNKCIVQVVGKNKFGKMPKDIAEYLQLPEPDLYTGHCFRRTSATVLADSGANITTLKRHGGWKSSTVAEGYIEESIKNKSKIGNLITSAITSGASTSTADENSNISEEPPVKNRKLDETIDVTETSQMDTSNQTKFFYFHNCANITINYNKTSD